MIQSIYSRLYGKGLVHQQQQSGSNMNCQVDPISNLGNNVLAANKTLDKDCISLLTLLVAFTVIHDCQFSRGFEETGDHDTKTL